MSFLTLPYTVDEVDGFNAPAAEANFESNIDFQEEVEGTVRARLRVLLN